MLCVDPALGTGDSNAGYAWVIGGELEEAGEFHYNPKDTADALRLFRRHVKSFGPVDVLVVEELRGSMVHPHLHWVVGVLVEAVQHDHLIKLPIPLWKAEAKLDPDYVKTDEGDARCFATTVLNLAKGVSIWEGAVGRASARPGSSQPRPKTTGPRSGRSKRSSASRRTKKRSKRC